MTLETWLLFCATDLVLSLTPGIAVTLVISSALARGAREGLLATFGILVANTLYFALSATGVGALLAASPRVFELVRWAARPTSSCSARRRFAPRSRSARCSARRRAARAKRARAAPSCAAS